MLLLYVDESGSVDDQSRHFVLGGVMVHEEDAPRLRREVAAVVAGRLDDHLRAIELHASRMRAGAGPWRSIPKDVRFGLLDDLAELLGSFVPTRKKGFALQAVIHEPGTLPAGANVFERVCEDLFLRATKMTIRFAKEHKSNDQCLAVLDDSKYESVIQPIANLWREQGTRFGRLTKMTRLIEVPLFTSSSVSLFIQLADLVAYIVYRAYEHGEWDRMNRMLPRFDTADDGSIHGLLHLNPNHRTCQCPACQRP